MLIRRDAGRWIAAGAAKLATTRILLSTRYSNIRLKVDL
jgi:hypothetical protein